MTTFTLTRPQDLLTLLPYRLGYHPSRCVAVAALLGRQLGPVARLDLVEEAHVDEAAMMVLGPLLRLQPSGLILIGYESVEGESEPLLGAIRAAAEQHGVEVLEMLLVRDGRFVSALCPHACCDGPGELLPAPEEVPAVAASVLAGAAPMESRAALRLCVTADEVLGAGVAEEIEQATANVGGPGERGRLWADVADLGGGAEPIAQWEPVRIARLVVSLRDVQWRDGVISALAGGLWRDIIEQPVRSDLAVVEAAVARWPKGDEVSKAIRARLFTVCRRVPDEAGNDAAEICAVAAAVAWEGGDGALAREAADRARRLRPDHRLAGLIERMLDLGVPPTRRNVDPMAS